MEGHHEAVAIIAANIRQFYDRKEAFRIYHGSTNSTRHSAVQRDRMIDTSSLSHVLEVNTTTKTALVEPNVPMDRLVQAVLPYGMVPPVVMEFPGITVGGGFAGTCGESSSFRYGWFDRTLNWVEIILANGSIITASSSENADLFHGAAGALGTLGVTTLVELRLVEAKTYVELTYLPVSSVSQAIERIKTATKDSSVDYVDGILFALNQGIIVTGRLTATVSATTTVQRFSRASDPWFYVHARSLAKRCSTTPSVEAVPLVDYLFRYDRGAFWTGAYAFQYFMVPFNRLTRWALDYFMHTRVMYHALHKSGHSARYVIQDIAFPFSTAQEFVEYVDETLGLYPLWLCPIKQSGQRSMHPHTPSRGSNTDREGGATTQDMLLNIGVWGPGPIDPKAFVAANRNLEAKVQELQGMKWMYAHAYYTEEEFWDIYHRKWYDSLRVKYEATSLLDVYSKVRVGDVSGAPDRAVNVSWSFWLMSSLWGIWPLSGLWGVLQVLIGGDYLLDKSK
ncbi:MAG: hypothetical protein M1827_006904 [Pycnora praestabilis]|nr:MAG: hypothetical protein M1827_006904 [Pycnora praestabilis]